MVSQSDIIVLTLQDELGRGSQRNLAKLWQTNLVHTMQKQSELLRVGIVYIAGCFEVLPNPFHCTQED